MMKTIIATVGTSMITNYTSKEGKNTVGQERYFLIDGVLHNLTPVNGGDPDACAIYDKRHEESISEVIDVIKDRWFRLKDGGPNEKASAEIASILKIAGGNSCKVHLLATDTLFSVLAAELISSWFEAFRDTYQIDVFFRRPPVNFRDQKESAFVVKHLQVSNGDTYKKGFQNLFLLLNRLLQEERRERRDVILNITGGYKAIIPPMVLFSQLNNIPVAYLYEGNMLSQNELITIAELPFGFDYSQLEGLVDYLAEKEMREKEKAIEVLKYLRKYKLVEEDSMDLTPVGDLLKGHIRQKTLDGKSMFGYIAELSLYVYYSNNGYVVRRGERYKDEELGEIEVDLILLNDSNEECWMEVKPLTKYQIQKATEQIEKQLKYMQKHLAHKTINKVGVVFYKPDFIPIERCKEELKKLLEVINSFDGVSPRICYFDVRYDAREMRPAYRAIAQNGIAEVHEVNTSEWIR